MSSGGDVPVHDGGTHDHEQIHLEVCSGFGDVGLSQQEWDSFLESAGGGVCLSRDWCEVWWKHYGGGKTLKVFVFRKNHSLVGLLPLVVDRITLGLVTVRVVKLVGVDYSLHACCLPLALDHIGPIAESFFEYMRTQDWWDIVFLGPISAIYQHTEVIAEALRSRVPPALRVRAATSGVQSIMDGLTRFEDYLNGLGSTTRRNITRSYTLMKKRGEELESSLCSEQDAVAQFRRFVEMHQEKWESEGWPGHFGAWPGSLPFHTDLVRAQAQRGRLRLMEIVIAGQTVGFDYSYRMGTTQWDVLNARTLRPTPTGVHVGKVIWCEVLKAALEQGVRTVDHMRGFYDYKKLLGFKCVPITSFFITRSSLPSTARVRLLFLCSRLLHLVGCSLWRNRIAPWLRIRRGPFPTLWIRTHWFGESSKQQAEP